MLNVPYDKVLNRWFEDQVEQTPDRVAVKDTAQHLTYKQLNEKAGQLAQVLRDRGIGPDTIAALMVEPSIHSIVGIMAILKAGGAYLPIDAAHPEERIRYIMADSGAKVLLKNLPEGRRLSNDQFNCQLSIVNCQLLMSAPHTPLYHPGHLAYVIYTSGSTGTPRGVMVEHRNAANLVLGLKERVYRKYSGILNIALVAPYIFDGSIKQIFGALLLGHTLHPVPADTRIDGVRLVEFYNKYRIDISDGTPAHLRLMTGVKPVPGVRHFLIGGEALAKSVVEGFYAGFSHRNAPLITNVYGPTECCVDSAAFEISKESIKELTVIPIGTPMPNQQVHIKGEPGELCISGANVSRGYLNNPEMTNSKFQITNKIEKGTDQKNSIDKSFWRSRNLFSKRFLAAGGKLYRTGDLARWLPDGNIQFLGRSDHQVKVRGFRIELGEIENRLLRHPMVKQAVVTARDDPYGEKYLCAYVVAGGMEPGAGELKRYLSVTLPAYMVPLFFVFLDQMPLTTAGKVDRQALPEPGPEPGTSYAAPVGAGEKALVKIWAEALGIPGEVIGIDDHFLERGGHSLKAAAVISGIFEKFQVRFSLVKVFEYPTIREMNRYIEQLSGEKEERYALINRVGEKPFYPLSSAQKRIYISGQLAPGTTLYNIPSVFHLEEEPDPVRLETAFKQLITRHETFRTSFHIIDDEPVQKIHQDVVFELETHVASFVRPFDLSYAPLLRAGLLKTGNGENLLLVDMHHIISDGLSMEIFERELWTLYAGETLLPLPLQYRDYAEWECKEQWQAQLKKQERYWLKEFGAEIPSIHLPPDYPRPPAQSFEGDTAVFELGIPETAALGQLAKEYRMTLYMLLAALYAIFLSKLTGRQEILAGTPVDGREHLHPDLKPVIGMFVNTVVIRNFPVSNKPLQRFFKEVRGIVMEVFENRDYPFERLVEGLRFQRDASGNALFNVMFAFRAGKNEKAESDLKFKRGKYHSGTARCDLTLTAYEAEKKLFFELNYCTKIFKVETIQRFAGYFKQLIRVVLENPGGDILLKDIDILPPGEREQLLYQFNDTAADYPADKTVHQLFEEQAALTPDKVALVFNRSYRSYRSYRFAPQHLTYRQLDKKSLELAFILREKGVEPGHIVGVMMERSIEMMTGIFGILKAGGVYLPIDPGYPAERTRYMVSDSGTGVLLSEESEASGDIEVIDLNEIIGPIGPIGPMLKELPAHPAQPCYVLYTSGSTGRPKGVLVEHRSLVNLCWWHLQYYGITAEDRATQYTNSCFDVSIWEIFPYLLKGVVLHILSRDIKPDIAALNRYFEVHCITIAFLPTPVCEQFMALKHSPLRALLTGGDKLQQYAARNYELYNNYGPTENTVIATACRVEAHTHNIPIGRPIHNTRIYILDKENARLQPLGVPGELCIAGDGLARGYLNKPELTAEQFNRSYKSYRTYILYKTGDLARWLSGGSIEFLGRIDHQVKIRGFRIESGEIENHLLKHQKIKNAVVTAHRAKTAEQYLCAYIVFHHDAGGNAGELKKYLSGLLPDYMIPAYFIRMDKIPLTPNGKVDRKALPAPGTAAFEGIDGEYAYAAPRDEVEEKLLTIWTELLPVKSESISVTADFFHIGGHSLKAVVMVSRIERVFNVKLPLSTVFQSPSIRELAQEVKETGRSSGDEIPAVEEKEFYPLSSAQKRLFFLDRLEKVGTGYNMTFGFEIKGKLDKERLKKVFLLLIKRHEALRTSFHLWGDEPVQEIHNQVDFEIQGLTSFSFLPFDLSCAPLFRVGLVDLSSGGLFLLIDMHHIIGDGTSIGILFRELSRLYNSDNMEAEAVKLPFLSLRYRDFTRWQNRLLQGEGMRGKEDYWLTLYADAGNLPRLQMPTDFPRPGRLSFEGDRYRFVLTPGQSTRFRHLSREYNATLYMSLMAAFNVLLYKYTGQGDIIIGTGTMGRGHALLEHMVGMFVNTLALRYYPAGDMPFHIFLNQVRTNSIRAFENQEVQFEALVDRLNLPRDPAHNPLFDVLFVLQNFQQPELTLENAVLKPCPLDKKDSKFDITLFAFEKEDHLTFGLEYNTALFKRKTIERFCRHFIRILHQVGDSPGISLDAVEILSEEERQQLVEEFNRTAADYPKTKTVHRLFEEQVAQTPDRAALQETYRTYMTYKKLNEKSNRLADYLSRGKSTVLEECIGLLLDRSIDLVASMLGVLKAGGAYVPLEPLLPEERIRTIIDDACIGVVVSQEKYLRMLNRLQWECASFHTYLCLDSFDIHAGEEKEKSELMDTKLWEYVGETAADDITGGGWISSYTGEPIPAREMAEYADNVLQKLRPLLHPDMRVLEIGCATGITMYRIAPLVGFYYGTDLSSVIIEKNRQRIREEGHYNIRLGCMAAHEVDQLDEKDFDLVIINSVIQCFHGHNYLRRVLKTMVAKMGNRGYLFIGDIMDRQMKGALIGELKEFKKNNPGKHYKTKTDWSAELFVSRDFFRDLSLDIPGIAGIEFSEKIHTIKNELTKFRYDALISIDKTGTNPADQKKKWKRCKNQEDLRVLARYGKRKAAVETGSHAAAYVIYTSGTTGTPGGVMVEHRSLVNLCWWHHRYYNITEADRATQYAASGFDASVWEIFPYLLKGVVLHIVGSDIKLDIVELNRYFERHCITIAFLPTPLCEQFMGLHNSSLRALLTGGDKLQRYVERNYELYNNYGPTENTVVTTACRVGAHSHNIPIGRPIHNTRIYILNKENSQLQPVGVPGELCIAGDGLARGCINKPELTAERFIKSFCGVQGRFFQKEPLAAGGSMLLHPFARPWGFPILQTVSQSLIGCTCHVPAGGKLYKTGDLARWLSDGSIEFLGRIDHQVKISGFRIEPGEIENRLLKHESVKEAVVTAGQDSSGNRYLCAYVSARSAGADELKEYLSQYLPAYMVPSFFVMLDRLPLTPGGKVDMKALPAPGVKTGKTYAAPGNEIEKKLVEIWSEILNITPHAVGIDDDFFELGGHSLKVIALTMSVLRELKTKVRIAEVFTHPTIRALAACIKRKGTAVESSFAITIPAVEKMDYYALSFSQKQLYILYQAFPLDTTYNMTTRRIVEGPLDRFKLETVFKSLIHRHESLRTSFHTVKGEPVQRIHKKVAFKIEYSPDIDHFIRSFDLSCAPLLRVGLVKMAENRHLLMVDMPHIVSDGLSHQLLVKEFMTLYRGEPLPELRLQYKDFSRWQNSEAMQQEIKIQENYWLEQFRDAVPVPDIPTDYPRPEIRVTRGTSMTFEIESMAAQKIRALAQEEGCTLFMLLLALYNVLLYKLSSREDIVVGTVVAGRRHPDLEHIMGVFVNTLALRNFPNGDTPFQQFLAEVKKHTLAAFDNQDYQFQELVRKAKKNRDTGRNPLFDVMFSFGAAEHNNSENSSGNREIPGRLYFKPYSRKRSQSLFDMTFSGFDNGVDFSFRIEYSTALFKHRTIERFAEYFKELVSSAVESPGILLKDMTISTHLSPALSDAFHDDKEDFGF